MNNKIKRFSENSEFSANKPRMTFNFRISNDSSGIPRFTEEEINNEIKNDNVNIQQGLLIRKGDGKVIGEFLIGD